MKTLLNALLFILISCCPLIANADAVVGQSAPQFQATASDGKTYSLSDLKGKYLVLEWFNNGCPFVKKHYNTGNMQALQKKYTEKGVAWLSVSSSASGKQGYLNDASIKEVATEWKPAHTALLLDRDGKIGKAYGAKTTPHMFVVDPDGKVIYAGAIDDNDSSRESSVAGAKNYVALALDAAMAGKPVEIASTESYGCSVKYEG